MWLPWPLVTTVLGCLVWWQGAQGAPLYSSFYAPLVQPRLLHYTVQARFDEGSGQYARETYQRMYGYRGQELIRELGSGRGALSAHSDRQVYGDVKFYYTYPGAGAYHQPTTTK